LHHFFGFILKVSSGFRVGHRVFAKQTQELFGSKKEIGIFTLIWVSLFILFKIFPKENSRYFVSKK
jgi:hypothetical protein